MRISISENVVVAMIVHGEDLSGSYGPGEVEVPEPVGELLLAQGIASKPTSKTKPSKNAEEA